MISQVELESKIIIKHFEKYNPDVITFLNTKDITELNLLKYLVLKILTNPSHTMNVGVAIYSQRYLIRIARKIYSVIKAIED